MKSKPVLEKTIGDTPKGFKVRINQPKSECKTANFICNFPRHDFPCVVKNNCLREPFLKLDVMLRLNKSNKLEKLCEQFSLKASYTKSNPKTTSN